MNDALGRGVSRRGFVTGSAAVTLVSDALPMSYAWAQAVRPKSGGTLNTILTPEPPVLMLGVNNQGPTQIAASKIFQGLLNYSRALGPMPSLAKAWEISDDKLSYTFHLQPGVKFHDGRSFTADDVIFSIMKFNTQLSPRARTIFQQIKAVNAPDPMTVKLTLGAPFEPFLLMFDVAACVIVPKHIYDVDDYRTNPANQKPIGTGPFMFMEWQRGNFIRMKRYDKYWKPDQPYLDEIIYRIIPDSQSRALALQTGQVQMTQGGDIEPFDIPRFRAQKNLAVNTGGWEYSSPLSWVEINHRVAPLGDARVRQAMSLAIDRNFIVQHLWFGVGKAATGPVASTTRFYDPTAKLPGFDPKQAMALLDAAGLKPNAQGVRFSIKHLPLPYGEVWQRLSEYLRASYKQIGIELILESTDAGAWAQRIGSWDYETSVNYLSQYGDPTLGVERSYVTSNIQKVTFTNTGGYSNPKVDALFAQARLAADPAQRNAAFGEVQHILVDDVPQIWLMELSFPTITDNRLQNVLEYGTGVASNFDDVFFA